MRFGQGYAAWTGGGRSGGGPRGSRNWGPFTVEWDMGGGPRGGGGRRRVFDGGELKLVLLKLAEEGPRHGYDLIRAVEERTGGAYAPSPGVVYPTLTLLADMQHLDEQPEGTRKLYAITEAGRVHLAEKAEEVAALFARLESLGAHQRRSEASPVRRALHNLRNVLRQKMEDLPPEKAHDIAEMIDELARRVERS